jgi:uncharacterized delta-60 repeat protein
MLKRRIVPRSGNRDARRGRQVTTGSNCPRLLEPLEGRLLMHAGDLDPSFGLGGQVSFNFGGYSAKQTDEIRVANGRVVVGGTVGSFVNDHFVPQRTTLAVFDSAGNPVKSFSDDGFKTYQLAVQGEMRDMLVQPDNEIVVLVANDQGGIVLARFNTDGSLDTLFGQNAIILDRAQDMARTPSGDIVVAGRSGPAGSGKVKLIRFNSNGALVSQLVTSVAGDVQDIAAQSDGKLVLITAVSNGPESSPTPTVLRIKSDLSGLDTTFSGDGKMALPNATFASTGGQEAVGADGGEIATDAQGRLVVGSSEVNATNVYRLTSSGAIDPTFTSTQILGSLADMSIAGNGKIVLSNWVTASGPFLFRLNANGGDDTGFAENGRETSGDGQFQEGYAGLFSAVQSDGRILTAWGNGPLYRLVADDATPVGAITVGADGVLHVTGTNGNDHVSLFGNSASINGRTATYQFTSIDVNLLGGNDRLDNTTVYGSGAQGTDAPRTIHAGAGNDYVEGGGGADIIAAEDGNDAIHANGGNDTIIDGPGTDLNDGGLGADSVDYSFRSGPVFVDLQGDADDGPAGEHDTVATSIESIIGSKGNDTLVGDARPNFIDGRGGNDTIRGGGGIDTLIGGLGQDKLYGEDGNDFLDAKDGITDLVLDGGTGTDTARKDSSDPTTSIEALFNG